MAPNYDLYVTGSKTFDITLIDTIDSNFHIDRYVQSEPITLGNYDWVIQLYPKGISGLLSDYVYVYLKVLNSNVTEECWAYYEFYTWNWIESIWKDISRKANGNRFQNLQQTRAGFCYARWTDLNSYQYAKNNMIRIKCDLLVTPRQPVSGPLLKPDVDKPVGTGNQGNLSGTNSSFNNGFHTADYAPPNAPDNSKLPRQPTVRIYCEANQDLSVTIRNGTVVLAPANSNDYYQHWIKDMTYADKVKDDNGFPAFALVNRVTAEAFQNPAGENQGVSLIPYNQNCLDNSVKWTEVASTGFRAIRITNIPTLNMTAIAKDAGFFNDGAKIVVQRWADTPIQHWKIVPYNSNVPY